MWAHNLVDAVTDHPAVQDIAAAVQRGEDPWRGPSAPPETRFYWAVVDGDRDVAMALAHRHAADPKFQRQIDELEDEHREELLPPPDTATQAEIIRLKNEWWAGAHSDDKRAQRAGWKAYDRAEKLKRRHYDKAQKGATQQRVATVTEGTPMPTAASAKPATQIPKPGKRPPEGFPGKTPVVTDRGIIPMQDVSKGDRVLDHNGKWTPVTDVHQRKGETVRVSGHGHPGIEGSAGHPVLVKSDDGSPGWLAAGLLGKQTKWATPTHIDPLPIPDGAPKTRSEWQLVGCYLRRGKIHGNDGLVYLRARSKDEAQSIRNATQNAEPQWYEKSVGDIHVFGSNNPKLSKWLAEHFGDKAHTKTVPPWVLGMDEGSRRSLLRGYYGPDWKPLPTTSPSLATGMRLVAETVGERTDIENVFAPFRPTYQARRMDDGHGHSGRHSWLGNQQARKAVRQQKLFDLEVDKGGGGSFVAGIGGKVVSAAGENRPPNPKPNNKASAKPPAQGAGGSGGGGGGGPAARAAQSAASRARDALRNAGSSLADALPSSVPTIGGRKPRARQRDTAGVVPLTPAEQQRVEQGIQSLADAKAKQGVGKADANSAALAQSVRAQEAARVAEDRLNRSGVSVAELASMRDADAAEGAVPGTAASRIAKERGLVRHDVTDVQRIEQSPTNLPADTRWRDIQTLPEFGEQTARWLEGSVPNHPGFQGRPQDETAAITPELARLNRAGLVTSGSQPGEAPVVDPDGATYAQRAFVEGFAVDRAAADRIEHEARAAGLEVHRHSGAAWRRHPENQLVVSTRDGQEITSAGHLSRNDVMGTSGGRLYGQFRDAEQIVIVDPEYGRNDRLTEFSERLAAPPPAPVDASPIKATERADASQMSTEEYFANRGHDPAYQRERNNGPAVEESLAAMAAAEKTHAPIILEPPMTAADAAAQARWEALPEDVRDRINQGFKPNDGEGKPCYDAEWAAATGLWGRDAHISPEEASRLAALVAPSVEFQHAPKDQHSHIAAEALVDQGVVRFYGPPTRNALSHELAHIVGGYDAQDHGGAFREAHLDVIERLYGRDARDSFAASYADAGLAGSPKPAANTDAEHAQDRGAAPARGASNPAEPHSLPLDQPDRAIPGAGPLFDRFATAEETNGTAPISQRTAAGQPVAATVDGRPVAAEIVDPTTVGTQSERQPTPVDNYGLAPGISAPHVQPRLEQGEAPLTVEQIAAASRDRDAQAVDWEQIEAALAGRAPMPKDQLELVGVQSGPALAEAAAGRSDGTSPLQDVGSTAPAGASVASENLTDLPGRTTATTLATPTDAPGPTAEEARLHAIARPDFYRSAEGRAEALHEHLGRMTPEERAAAAPDAVRQYQEGLRDDWERAVGGGLEMPRIPNQYLGDLAEHLPEHPKPRIDPDTIAAPTAQPRASMQDRTQEEWSQIAARHFATAEAGRAAGYPEERISEALGRSLDDDWNRGGFGIRTGGDRPADGDRIEWPEVKPFEPADRARDDRPDGWRDEPIRVPMDVGNQDLREAGRQHNLEPQNGQSLHPEMRHDPSGVDEAMTEHAHQLDAAMRNGDSRRAVEIAFANQGMAEEFAGRARDLHGIELDADALRAADPFEFETRGSSKPVLDSLMSEDARASAAQNQPEITEGKPATDEAPDAERHSHDPHARNTETPEADGKPNAKPEVPSKDDADEPTPDRQAERQSNDEDDSKAGLGKEAQGGDDTPSPKPEAKETQPEPDAKPDPKPELEAADHKPKDDPEPEAEKPDPTPEPKHERTPEPNRSEPSPEPSRDTAAETRDLAPDHSASESATPSNDMGGPSHGIE